MASNHSIGMADTNSNIARRFQSRVGDETFEIVVEGDRVFINGEERSTDLREVVPGRYSMLFDGVSHSVVEDSRNDDSVNLMIDGRLLNVQVRDEKQLLLERFSAAESAAEGIGEIRAPMPGLVVRVLVAVGDTVSSGDGLLVLEAMKMENELRIHTDGRIRSIHVNEGDAVIKRALLIEFEAECRP